MAFIQSLKNKVSDKKTELGWQKLLKLCASIMVTLLVAGYLIAVYWSLEPDIFDVKSSNAYVNNSQKEDTLIVGYTLVNTTITLGETLLDKPGGYLSNDIMPPSIWMDNMPSWEFGVLVQIRDMVSALRDHMSRSQSQSLEDLDLQQAEPLLNNNHDSWIWPDAQNRYREGIGRLKAYRDNLSSNQESDVQFYSRADNLRIWLETVEKRLGSISQRLSASVGQQRVNTDLAGDASAQQSTEKEQNIKVKTSWWELDDNFYEARGTCWALLHLLKAVEVDFAQVLDKKNARVSLQQIIRELESTQETVWSPMILNGSGFGFLANHSLVMASYVARANAGIIDLRRLLEQG